MREGQSFTELMEKKTKGGDKCPHCDTWYRRGVEHGREDAGIDEKRAYARGFTAGRKQSREKPPRVGGRGVTYKPDKVIAEYERVKTLDIPKHKMMQHVADAVGCALTTAYLITRKHRKLRKSRKNKAVDGVPS